jgi:hypothetical protein
MKNANDIVIWDETPVTPVPAGISQPDQVAAFAKQLSVREKNQIVSAFQNESYEIATSFVWHRAMASLKRELGTLGVTFLAELLGRTDVDEDANVLDVISEIEAIRLAEELGVVSSTEAMRLRHYQELISHFCQRDPSKGDEPMEKSEAESILLSCVRSVLAKPSIQVAQEFADFRKELETKSFSPNDQRIDDIQSSPYFFQRLAVVVLLSGIRSNTGAQLEHCLNNLNVLLPLLWPKLREAERWQVGATYSHVYANGLQVQTAGLKQALLKVQGFDYVPETLRSQTFLKAAEAIIKAHDEMNNFYNEEAPTSNLEKLGTVIPAPALGRCITALLCVRLGNFYGVSWSAKPIADRLLRKQSQDRWGHYLDQVLPSETRILDKLISENPRKQWFTLCEELLGQLPPPKNKLVRQLLSASLSKDVKAANNAAMRLRAEYYGK